MAPRAVVVLALEVHQNEQHLEGNQEVSVAHEAGQFLACTKGHSKDSLRQTAAYMQGA